MSIRKKIAQRAARRTNRVKSRLKTGELLRVSVFRSLNNIYAQLIDDQEQKTIASFSSLEFLKSSKDFEGDKKAIAFEVGKKLAQYALDQDVKVAMLDRGSFLYHGRVKALTEGLREGGLKI